MDAPVILKGIYRCLCAKCIYVLLWPKIDVFTKLKYPIHKHIPKINYVVYKPGPKNGPILVIFQLIAG